MLIHKKTFHLELKEPNWSEFSIFAQDTYIQELTKLKTKFLVLRTDLMSCILHIKSLKYLGLH